jgi:hypothetical protein
VCISAAIYSSVMTNKLSQYTMSDVVPAVIQAGLPPGSVEPFLTALNEANLPAAKQVPGVTASVIQAGISTLTEAWAKTFKIGRFPLRAP